MSERNELYHFIWTIENYSFCNCMHGRRVCSPTFKTNSSYVNYWTIFFFPKGYKDRNFASLILSGHADNQLVGQVDTSIHIELCDSNNKIFASEEKIEAWIGNSNQFSFLSLISIKELEKEVKKSDKDTLTIRCRINISTPVAPPPRTPVAPYPERPLVVNISGNTEISYNMFSFLWRVNFIPFTKPASSNTWFPTWSSTLSEKNTFSINNDTHFCVTLTCPQDEIMFEIVHVSEKKVPFIRVKCKIILLNREGIEKFSCCDSFTFDERNSCWSFPSFLKKSLLGQITTEYSVLNLKFNFKFSNGIGFKKIIHETQNSNLSSSSSKSLSAINYLKNDFLAMLLNKKHTDVTFRTEEGIINAHKCILASRSPVFSAMFDQNMVENQTGVVDISDMDAQTLRLFLEFIYTGDIEEFDWKKALDLLLASEKYQVSSLKDKCSEFLKANLSIDYICDVVSAADMVGHQILKATAIDFIKENSTEILESPKWHGWVKKNVELCSEIFYSLSQEFKTFQRRK